MKRLSDFSGRELMEEVKRRGEMERNNKIIDMLMRLEKDVMYIDSMTVDGAPRSGSYKVEFTVYK